MFTPRGLVLATLAAVRLTGLALALCACAAGQAALTPRQYEEDFDYFWRAVAEDYAYLDEKQTDWDRVRELYRPRASAVRTRAEFVTLLETALEELYDAHAHLNANTQSSPRLVPSGADIWAEWVGGRAVVTEVRPGSAAERAGLRAGMEVLAFNGVAIGEAVRARTGKTLRAPDRAADGWALRAVLAGRRNEGRKIEVLGRGERRLISVVGEPAVAPQRTRPLLEYRRVGGGVGYVRVNNSLGETELVKQFDEALARLRDTRALILDLRDTPGGGNTTVARGIMGRFVRRELPYQKHSLPSEERRYGTKRSWLELVSPRGPFVYDAPVVVLVNHWTGSMGEGIAVGMDGTGRAVVVGTEMARLAGAATSGVRLPHTGVGVTFPVEKLFHVNGTPRERFVPPVYVDLSRRGSRPGADPILEAGLRRLRAMLRAKGRGRPVN